MEFIKANESYYDLVYDMLIKARNKLFEEGIFQWDHRYPKPDMIRSDLINGYTSVVRELERLIAFFTSNSICEDDIHNEINWLYNGDRWVILHRLCVDPHYQGNGVGQKILEKFEQQCIADKYESIRIDVFSTNQAAIHIYEKHGYSRVGSAVCERGPFYVYEKEIG